MLMGIELKHKMVVLRECLENTDNSNYYILKPS